MSTSEDFNDFELLDLDELLEDGSASKSKEYPLTATDMLDILDSQSVKTGEITSALSIPPSRWAKITTTAVDGRDMAYEFIPAELEIYIRLVDLFPEFAPWKRISPSKLMEVTGWTQKELAFVCTTTDVAVSRWQNNAERKMTAQTSVLINLMYRMVTSGKVSPDQIMSVARTMHAYRNGHDVSSLQPQSWTMKFEQVYRRVRKATKKALVALCIDGEKEKKDTEYAALIHELISEKLTVKELAKRSKATASVKDKQLKICEYAVNWFKIRNEYQVAYVKTIKELNGTVVTDNAKLVELREQLDRASDLLGQETDTSFRLG